MYSYVFLNYYVLLTIHFLKNAIQIKKSFLGINLEFLAKIWVFLSLLTVFYKCAYQVAVFLGLSTAENTLFVQLLNTFAYLTSRIFDSLAGSTYSHYANTRTYQDYNVKISYKTFETIQIA